MGGLVTFQSTHLIGFAVGGSPLELEQVLSATSTAATITFPSGILAGDLIVLWDTAVNSSGTPTDVIPTGFTGAYSTSATPIRVRLSYKIATGSESGSLTGMNSSFARSKTMVVYRGSRPISGVTLGGLIASGITGSNPAAQNITSGLGVAPLIVCGFYWANGAVVNPRTFSPAKDGEITAGGATCSNYSAWKIYNSAPVDVSVDMDDEGSNFVGGSYFSCE